MENLMTNKQIPMTKQEDNDQCINDQTGNRHLYHYFFGYWLLFVSLVIGIWSLVIIRGTGNPVVLNRCFETRQVGGMDYPGWQLVMGKRDTDDGNA